MIISIHNFYFVCLYCMGIFFRSILALNSTVPSWKIWVFIFLLAVFGSYESSASVPPVNTVFQFGAPVLPPGGGHWPRHICNRSGFSRSYYYNIEPKVVPNIQGSLLCRPRLLCSLSIFFALLFCLHTFTVLMCFLSPVLACILLLNSCQALQ